MAKELTMVEISYDFDALNLDMESGNLKFNLTINQMVKDGELEESLAKEIKSELENCDGSGSKKIGKKYNIHFGQKLGNGQATSLFSRNQPLVVEVKQEGCPSKTQTFDKSFRTGNFILSALSFGLVGIAVDLGTGASYKPAHNSNSAIKKLSDKNYEFEVDYSECKK